MPTEAATSEARGTPVRGTRRYKRRELRLPDGGSLVLAAGGSIEHMAADGTTTHTWAPDDPDWPRQAIRFGVRPQGATVTPHGRQEWDLRPPRR